MMKVLIFLLTFALFASNGFWLYREFDRGITQTYRNQESYERANIIVAASALASEAVRDKSKEEVKAILKQLFPGEQVFEKDGALHTTWLLLPLTANGRVSGVAANSEIMKQSESKVRGVVGNEVFWPKK